MKGRVLFTLIGSAFVCLLLAGVGEAPNIGLRLLKDSQVQPESAGPGLAVIPQSGITHSLRSRETDQEGTDQTGGWN